jgi:hypothetical protein
MGFCWGRPAGVTWRVSGGDEDPAELGDHVSGGRLGLGPLAGSAGTVLVDVIGMMPGGPVPQDGEALACQGERDGAVHRGCQPVAGLPGSEDLLGVFDGDLDGYVGPARAPGSWPAALRQGGTRSRVAPSACGVPMPAGTPRARAVG